MAVLKKLLLALALLVVVLAGIGMLLPRKVHVERQITIDAPRATVFALIDGFKRFNEWSPWAALDPNTRYTYEGPEYGVGARQSWTGDPKKVGAGTQEIVEATPPELVVSKLDFAGQGPAMARWSLTPAANGSQVTWSLDSDMGAGPIGRYFGLVMDRMVGPDFERGLANLKRLAESLPKADFADLDVTRIEAVPVTVAYVEASCSKDPTEIGRAIGAAYGKVGAFMRAHALTQAGAPITINTRWDETGYAFEAAIPVDKSPAEPPVSDAPVKVKATYAGPALKVVMKGPYTAMPATYEKLKAFMAARGYVAAGPPWDEYVSDPGATPEAELVTNIVQPVK